MRDSWQLLGHLRRVICFGVGMRVVVWHAGKMLDEPSCVRRPSVEKRTDSVRAVSSIAKASRLMASGVTGYEAGLAGRSQASQVVGISRVCEVEESNLLQQNAGFSQSFPTPGLPMLPRPAVSEDIPHFRICGACHASWRITEDIRKGNSKLDEGNDQGLLNMEGSANSRSHFGDRADHEANDDREPQHPHQRSFA